MNYNEQLLADIAEAMMGRHGILCDNACRIEVAKLLVDSIEGAEDPIAVEVHSGYVLPTETWDGYKVKITDCADVWDIEVFCMIDNANKVLVGDAFIPDEAMAELRCRVIQDKKYTTETYLASVVKAIRWHMNYRSDTEQDVAEWNDYVSSTGLGTPIYSNLIDLARDYYADAPGELARAMFFGELRNWNDYVYIDVCGNIRSIEDLGEHILYDNLALWLYSQGRVEIRVNVQAGEPGEETWDVEIVGAKVSLEDVIENVKHELQHEIEMGYVTLDPATWLIDVDVREIE